MTAATDKSIARLRTAISKHDIGSDMADAILAKLDSGLASQTVVSSMIGLVESAPEKPQARAAREFKVENPGYYEYENAAGETLVAKVNRSKKGYLYALEQRPGGQWKFISGLISKLDSRRETDAPAPIPATADDFQRLLDAM